MRIIAVLPILALGVACTSPRGFDRGSLAAALAPEAVVTEEEIERTLELRPQLAKPFTLGVYFKTPVDAPVSPYYYPANRWSWTPEDKELLLGVGASLQRKGLVSKTVFISGSTASGQKLKSIRLAAARHGVDAVLIVSGASEIDRYNNAAGAAYALLVTALFVPGTVVDGLFISHAGLWDVQNGFLYASVEADGQSRTTGPAAFVSEDWAVEEAKEQSVASLANAVEQHIENLDR